MILLNFLTGSFIIQKINTIRNPIISFFSESINLSSIKAVTWVFVVHSNDNYDVLIHI